MSEFLNTDQVKRELSPVETFTFLWKFTQGFRGQFFIYCALVFTGGLLGAFAASQFGSLIEKLIQPDSTINNKDVYLLASFEMASIAFIFFGRRGLSVNALKAIFQLRVFLFDHMKKLPMNYYDREPVGRIVTRLTHDVDTLESFYSSTLARLLSVFLTASTVIIVMIQHTWWLGIISSLLTLPSILLVWLFRVKAHHFYRDYSRTSSAITAKLAEFLNGMGVIRSFGLEDWSFKHFENRLTNFMTAADRVNFFNSWMRPSTLVLTYLPTFFLFGTGSFMVVKGTLSLGALVAFLRLSDRLARPAGALMMEINVIQTAISSTERITTFLEEPFEEINLKEDHQKKLNGSIEFKNLWMSYAPAAENQEDKVEKTNWVLKNFSLHIKAGEKIGVMGRTGSGKSTLISLISRLYPYQKGSLLIDNSPIESLELAQLRSQIGFVSQATFLIPASIRENLSLGFSLSDEKIWQACLETGLAKHLKDSNRNLDSLVNTQGSNFSQGEAQLFALTRVLLQDPSIFVLDEATANLDAMLEKQVQQAIEKVARGRTCIFIAHRLSTLIRCERVIILQNGELINTVRGQDLVQPSSQILTHLENPN